MINAGRHKNAHAFSEDSVFSLCEKTVNGEHLSTTLPTDLLCKVCKKRSEKQK